MLQCRLSRGLQAAQDYVQIRPQISPMRLLFTETEPLHWRFICVQHSLLQDLSMKASTNGCNCAARARKRLASIEVSNARPRKDLLPTMSGRVVCEFLD